MVYTRIMKVEEVFFFLKRTTAGEAPAVRNFYYPFAVEEDLVEWVSGN